MVGYAIQKHLSGAYMRPYSIDAPRNVDKVNVQFEFSVHHSENIATLRQKQMNSVTCHPLIRHHNPFRRLKQRSSNSF